MPAPPSEDRTNPSDGHDFRVQAPSPYDGQDPVSMALALRRDVDLDAAIQLLYDAWALNLADTAIATTLATMLAENEQFDRAERVFNRALGTSPDDEGLQLNYATFLAHSGRHAEAAPQFRRAAARSVRDLQRAVTAREDAPMAEALRKLAFADCNLAHSHVLQGETGLARDLAERWLMLECAGDAATDIVAMCVEAEEGDWLAECARLQAEHRASSAILAELADVGLAPGTVEESE